MTPEVQIVADKILQTYKSWGRDSSFQSRRESWDDFLKNPAAIARLEYLEINGLAAAWLKPGETASSKVILFVHGGGFQIGSILSHAELAARLSDLTGFDTLLFDYHLAPEHAFPVAIEDTLAAYEFLITSGFAPSEISLIGDSAGANLILSLVQKLKNTDQELPFALGLMSPWTDMQLRGESYETRSAVDPIHQKKILARSAETYLGGHPATDPLVSPMNADVSGFPPTLIQVGDLETVLSDAADFAQRLKDANVNCELRIWQNMIHVFQQFPELPEAIQAVREMADFILQVEKNMTHKNITNRTANS